MTQFTTPVGSAQYPWLSSADTKFQELGEYKVNLILSEEDAAPIIQMVEAAIEQKATAEKAKKRANLPYTIQEDGTVLFKFKNRNRQNRDGKLWDRKPLLVDTKGNPCDVEVGGGSKLRIKGEVYTWANPALGAGASLQMKAVQIVELEPIKKDVFDAIEGSFEAEDEPVRSETASEGLF